MSPLRSLCAWIRSFFISLIWMYSAITIGIWSISISRLYSGVDFFSIIRDVVSLWMMEYSLRQLMICAFFAAFIATKVLSER